MKEKNILNSSIWKYISIVFNKCTKNNKEKDILEKSYEKI